MNQPPCPSPRGALPLRLLCLLIIAVQTQAQPSPDRVVIVSELPGAVRTGLFEINAATGTTTPLGTFALASLEPLAVAFDVVNRNLVVALRDVGPISRIVRLGFQGAAVLDERLIATLPGVVTDLEFQISGDVLASVDGPAGGIWRMPRAGGPVTQIAGLPYVTAFDTPYPGAGLLVQSFPTGDPTLSFIDLGTGAITPYTLPGLAGLRITGVRDMPTGAVRQGLSDDQGGLHRFEFFSLLTTWVTPPLPIGASNEIELSNNLTSEYLVLGGAGSPFLRTVPIFGATATTLAGPLPGDPKDMTLSATATANFHSFGPTSCGPGAGTMNWGGSLPSLGATVSVTLAGGLPNAPAILGMGLSDVSWGVLPLPLTLPGGCTLLIAPDQPLTTQTDATGTATFTFAIPNDPLLAGTILFGQWGQPSAAGWRMTAGLAAHIW